MTVLSRAFFLLTSFALSVSFSLAVPERTYSGFDPALCTLSRTRLERSGWGISQSNDFGTGEVGQYGGSDQIYYTW